LPKTTTNEERMAKARQLIEDARHLPVPAELGWQDFSYIARVKDTLRQAHDQVKFIRFSPSASTVMKTDAQALLAEVERVEKEILHR
jgi:hypothetical protein